MRGTKQQVKFAHALSVLDKILKHARVLMCSRMKHAHVNLIARICELMLMFRVIKLVITCFIGRLALF